MTVPDPPARAGTPLRDRPIGGVAPAESTTKSRRRHCWVDLTEHPRFSDAARAEGLVLQWAQDTRGWVALVVHVIPTVDGDLTVQEWVPASRLRPDSGQK